MVLVIFHDPPDIYILPCTSYQVKYTYTYRTVFSIISPTDTPRISLTRADTAND